MWGPSRDGRWATVFAGALVLLLAAPAARAADPTVTVAYKGTLSEKYVANTGDPSDYTAELTLNWTETATDDGVTHEPLSGPAFTASGSIAITSAHEHPRGCSGSFSTRPGPYGNSPAGFIGGGLVSIAAVLPASGKYVQSSGTEGCSLAANEALGVGGPGVTDPELIAASAPTETFPESQPSLTHMFKVAHAVHREPAPNGLFESENTLSLSATLTAITTVHAGKQEPAKPGSGPGGGVKSKPGKRKGPLTVGHRIHEIKEQARRDLPESIREAWAAHGLSALRALPTAPLLSIADELGQAAGPIAANDATTRVLDDFRIYKDPPLHDVDTLAKPAPVAAATLPACKQPLPSSESAYCANLSSAYTTLLASDGEATADTAALEQTVDRASAAARARNAPALRLQEGHALALARTLATARVAKRKAAGQVRSLLVLAQPRWALSRAESKTAIGWETARLAKHGLRGRTLRRLAGSALSADKTDVLQRL